MNKQWIKLMETQSEGGGGASPAPTPANSLPPADSSPSPETPSVPASESVATPIPAERSSAITPEVADKLGIPHGIKAIEVKPLQALGLSEKPSDAIRAMIAKEGLKINRGAIYEKKQAIPATTPITGQAAIVSPSSTPASQTTPATPQAQNPPVITPAQIQKYKIGDQEYTAEQMAAYIEGQRQTQALVAQQQPQQIQPPAQKLTPEQQKEYVRSRESQFISETAPNIDLSIAGTAITSEQADVLAAGGPEAVKLHNEIQQRNISHATLLARKTIAAEINPILDQAERLMQNQAQIIAPLIERERAIAVWETEQAFVKTYPDLVPHIETAKIIGQELVRQYPDWARSVSREEFLKQVAEQTPQVLQRFGISMNNNPPANGNNPVTPAIVTSKNPAQGIKIPIKTSSTPRPIVGQAPGKQAAIQAPVQSQRDFQKVAVGSVSNLR